MSQNTTSSGYIYRMSIEYNNTFSESTPTSTYGATFFSSSLKSVSAIKYGAGYLWIAGTTTTGTSIPALVQVDVTTNMVITTIPLITLSSYGGKGFGSSFPGT